MTQLVFDLADAVWLYFDEILQLWILLDIHNPKTLIIYQKQNKQQTKRHPHNVHLLVL